MEDCGCRDLGYRGNIFTWQWENSVETLVRDRLDRCMADNHWCSMFSYAEVIHFPICHSDHGVVLLNFGGKPPTRQNGKLFRFEAMWLSNDECGKVVSNTWLKGVGDPIHSRSEHLAASLSSRAGETFEDVRKRIKYAEKKLKEMQGGPLIAYLLQRCHEISDELQDLCKLEESYWYARVRANELCDGDKNTIYFHHKATHHQKRNNIRGLYNERGEWKDEKADMDAFIADYFSNLFATEHPSGLVEALAGVEEVITREMNMALDSEPKGEVFEKHYFKCTLTRRRVQMECMHSFSRSSGVQWVK